jgi:hypothetical protein
MLAEQLFLASDRTPPRPYAMWRVRNDWDCRYSGLGKPSGGLWTSTVGGRDSWLSFCVRDAGFHKGSTPWVLQPWDDAKVFTLQGPESLAMLRRAYGSYVPMYEGSPRPRWRYDWELMRADGWDGFHLATPFSPQLRFNPDDMTWYGWDCVCTLWLRWVFLERPRRLSPEELQRLIASC